MRQRARAESGWMNSDRAVVRFSLFACRSCSGSTFLTRMTENTRILVQAAALRV
jgi:hypothetical protein